MKHYPKNGPVEIFVLFFSAQEMAKAEQDAVFNVVCLLVYFDVSFIESWNYFDLNVLIKSFLPLKINKPIKILFTSKP